MNTDMIIGLVIGALITTVTNFFLQFLNYKFIKNKEISLDMKLNSYKSFFDSLSNVILKNMEPSEDKDYSIARNLLFLTSTDELLNSLIKYEVELGVKHDPQNPIDIALLKLLLNIRKELGFNNENSEWQEKFYIGKFYINHKDFKQE